MTARSPSTLCDCCGRAMDKAHARWEGRAYCGTCYKREFVAVPCQDCGRTIRVLKGVSEGQCPQCRTRGRRCVRCGKPTPRADLIIDDGAVCPSCVRYFKPPQACPVCGQLSLFLARDFKAGFTEPVCPSCRRKGYITCPGCGKHRRPAGVSTSGQVLCRRCIDADGQPFVCPQCGQPGRRHSARRCEVCYWRDTGASRTTDAVALLRGSWTKEAFADFMAELADRVGPQRAALRLHRYFLFFAKLDVSFESPAAMTAGRIAALIGAEGLRRYAVPYGFLSHRGSVPPAADGTLQEAHEADRQQRLLVRISGQWYEDVLTRYRHHLDAIGQRYARRGWHGERRRFLPQTVTRNLRAAARFLAEVGAWGVQTPQQITQLHLDRFIQTHPGYRDSVRSLVRYLNRKEKLFRPLKIATVTRNLPPGLFLGQDRYHELLRIWLGADDRAVKQSLICLLLLLYAQSIRRVIRLRVSDLLRDQTGTYRVRFGKVEIPLHQAVGALLTRYLAIRTSLGTMDDAWTNPYLFTGRGGGHLTEGAVTQYLRRYDVTAGMLFSTAIYQAYVGGTRHPKTLVQAFGVSPATAVKYLDLIDPRLRAEIEEKAGHG